MSGTAVGVASSSPELREPGDEARNLNVTLTFMLYTARVRHLSLAFINL